MPLHPAGAQVHVSAIVGGVLAAGAREDELPLLADLLWAALPLMQRTVSANLLQGACGRAGGAAPVGGGGDARPLSVTASDAAASSWRKGGPRAC